MGQLMGRTGCCPTLRGLHDGCPWALPSPTTWPNTATCGRGRSQGTTELVSSSLLSLQTGLFFYFCFHVLYFCTRVTSKKRGLLLKHSEVTVRSFSLRGGSLCGHSSHKYVLSVCSLHPCSAAVCSSAVVSGRPSL